MLDIAIHNPRQHRQFQRVKGPLVLARSPQGEMLWLSVDEVRAQQSDALIEIVPDQTGVELAMTGCEAECNSGRACGLTGHCHLQVPARFSIGDTRFEIRDAAARPASLRRPLERLFRGQPTRTPGKRGLAGPSPATLSKWFGALATLNRWTTSLQELYDQAARSAVDSIGLDGAVVLRRRDNEWEIAASYLPRPELGVHCDRDVLDELLAEPQTLFHGAGPGDEESGEGSNEEGHAYGTTYGNAEQSEPSDDETSLALDLLESARTVLPRRADASRSTQEDLDLGRRKESELTPAPDGLAAPPAVVVSPLRNAAGELVGAIYGYRSIREGNARRGIRYLEANLVELLACAVTEGIARMEHEAEVDRRRVLMEQALLAKHGEDPRRLAGQQREVTLLFADLRGFTALAAALGTEQVYELLGQVMDCLTAAVMDHDGLVIDYYGDGLAAMWNAPANQADHPELACRAALRMLETLPSFEANWKPLLETGLRLGVGVHTGIVRVGNAGSSRRLKYGPRGTNVHLASRVESATKEIGLPALVSEATAGRLSNRFTTFRVCRGTLPGMDWPIDLYGFCAAAAVDGEERARTTRAIDAYTEALRLFEKGDLERAAKLLAKIDPAIGAVPVEFLQGQVERALGQRQERRSTDRPAGQSVPMIVLRAK